MPRDSPSGARSSKRWLKNSPRARGLSSRSTQSNRSSIKTAALARRKLPGRSHDTVEVYFSWRRAVVPSWFIPWFSNYHDGTTTRRRWQRTKRLKPSFDAALPPFCSSGARQARDIGGSTGGREPSRFVPGVRALGAAGGFEGQGGVFLGDARRLGDSHAADFLDQARQVRQKHQDRGRRKAPASTSGRPAVCPCGNTHRASTPRW